MQHATCRTQLAMHSLRLEAGMVHRARTGQPPTCCNSVQCVAALPNVKRHLYPRRPWPTLTLCSVLYCAATCCTVLQHGALGCTTPERPAAALPTPAPADPHAFGTPPYPRYAPHDAGLCSTTSRTALSQPAAHVLSAAELCARNGPPTWRDPARHGVTPDRSSILGEGLHDRGHRKLRHAARLARAALPADD